MRGREEDTHKSTEKGERGRVGNHALRKEREGE